jgi:hypothetical protein
LSRSRVKKEKVVSSKWTIVKGGKINKGNIDTSESAIIQANKFAIGRVFIPKELKGKILFVWTPQGVQIVDKDGNLKEKKSKKVIVHDVQYAGR